MGKGDKKTRKGKIFTSTFGKHRAKASAKRAIAKKAAQAQ
jgi:ribosomal small subunit protein bTHX